MLSQLKSLLFKEKYLKKITRGINEYVISNNSHYDKKIQGCKNQLNGIDAKIKNILTAMENGVSEPSLYNRLEELKGSKELTENEIKNLEAEKQTPTISQEQVEALLKKLKKLIFKNDIPEVKKFISHYVKKVVVYSDNIEVELKIDRNIKRGS